MEEKIKSWVVCMIYPGGGRSGVKLMLLSHAGHFFFFQEPTARLSKKKMVVPEVDVSEEGVCCKIVFL